MVDTPGWVRGNPNEVVDRPLERHVGNVESIRWQACLQKLSGGGILEAQIVRIRVPGHGKAIADDIVDDLALPIYFLDESEVDPLVESHTCCSRSDIREESFDPLPDPFRSTSVFGSDVAGTVFVEHGFVGEGRLGEKGECFVRSLLDQPILEEGQDLLTKNIQLVRGSVAGTSGTNLHPIGTDEYGCEILFESSRRQEAKGELYLCFSRVPRAGFELPAAGDELEPLSFEGLRGFVWVSSDGKTV